MTEGTTENLLGRRATKLKTDVVGGNRYADSPYFIPGVGENAKNSIDLPAATLDADGNAVETEWDTKALCGRFVEMVRFTKKEGKVKEGAYIVLNQVDSEGRAIENSFLRMQAPGSIQKKVENGAIVVGRYIELLYLGKQKGEGNDPQEYHRFAVRGEVSTH